MAFGDYPAEYNPNVHGPYDPARFYGKRKCLLNAPNFLVKISFKLNVKQPMSHYITNFFHNH